MLILLLFIDNGYLMHRLAVVLSAIIMSGVILFFTNNLNLLLLLNLIFLCFLANIIFYDLVPRKSNPFFLNLNLRFLLFDKKVSINNKGRTDG